MTSTVVLPNENCGIAFLGSPPRVESIAQSSPVLGKLKIGQYVHGFVARKKEIVYSGITTANELARLLIKHRQHNRVLILSSKISIVLNRSMTTTITLPDNEERLGLVFCHGGPPRISDIRVGSALQSVAAEGMYVHELKVPGVNYRGFASPEELAHRLWLHRRQYPCSMVLSHRPPPIKVEPLLRITLPPGPALIHLKTDIPTVILDQVETESPLAYLDLTTEPKWRIISLEMPEQEDGGNTAEIKDLHQKFTSFVLEKALYDSEKIEGRILTLQRESQQHTLKFCEEEEDNLMIYPSTEDVSMKVHRQSKAFELFGRCSAIHPETRVGHTADFFMRTGLPEEDAAYYFENMDGNPWKQCNIHMICKRATPSSNGKDYWLKDLTYGEENSIGMVRDHVDNSKHCFQIFGCFPRHRFMNAPRRWQRNSYVNQEKSSIITLHGERLYPWAIVHDSSWKDQIDTREVSFCSPNNNSNLTQPQEEKWFVPTLFLSRHHLAVVTPSRDLVAILFRRNYTDETQRHQWVVSVAPGIDPCFIMCLAVCLDKLVVHS
mmetsp:Transcript_34020/g.38714  ORF Transcript_34020/g.38714 Transcript_34020/m.38714 type:complete len:550 (+) Transcript_34020:57-1706(+)